MELLSIIFTGLLFFISIFLVVYSYLYLRTSKNSMTLVGTHIHPLISRFIIITILLAGFVCIGSLVLLIQSLITLL